MSIVQINWNVSPQWTFLHKDELNGLIKVDAVDMDTQIKSE